jgi:hypothetical protein
MLHPRIKADCSHAYISLLVVVAIFMALFTAAMHGQELPSAPQAAVRQQETHAHKPRLLPARPGKPDLGSAEWFRGRGHFRMARFMPVLTHIDWDISYGKSKDTSHSSHKSR